MDDDSRRFINMQHTVVCTRGEKKKRRLIFIRYDRWVDFTDSFDDAIGGGEEMTILSSDRIT